MDDIIQTMSLEYVWVNNYKCFRDGPFEFSFTGQFHVEFDGRTLCVRKNEDYLNHVKLLFEQDSPVSDCSIVVGENGSGKTSLFTLLFDAFIPGCIKDKETDYLLLFKTEGGRLLCKTNLNKNRLDIKTDCSASFVSDKIYSDSQICFVYYSPLFSTEHAFPDVLNQDFLFDISTSKLLCDDVTEFDNEISPELCRNSQITGHRRIDTKRVIAFLSACENDELSMDLLKDFYPKSVIVQPRNPGFFLKDDYVNRYDREGMVTKLLGWLKKAHSCRESIYASAIMQFVTAHYRPGSGFDGGANERIAARIDALTSSDGDVENGVRTFLSALQADMEYLGFSKNSFGIPRVLEFFYVVDGVCSEYEKSGALSFPLSGRSMSDLLTLYEKYIATGFVEDFLELFLEPHISSGEYFMLCLFARLYWLFTSQHEKLKGQDIVLCMDEVETTLHPSLQRVAVYRIIEFLNAVADSLKLDVHLHVIFASHSPFLLSDFHQSNAVRLKKNGRYIQEDKLTFAANVYDLYKDSFFLDEGVIGEFARKIIEKSLDKPCDESDFKALVSEIADPVLKILVNETAATIGERNDAD